MATSVLTALLFIGQNIGWSRLNMPYLLGPFFAAERNEANVLGFMLYTLGGWLFAFLYYLLFSVIGLANGLTGAFVGLFHAALLLTLILPMLPISIRGLPRSSTDPTPGRYWSRRAFGGCTTAIERRSSCSSRKRAMV